MPFLEAETALAEANVAGVGTKVVRDEIRVLRGCEGVLQTFNTLHEDSTT